MFWESCVKKKNMFFICDAAWAGTFTINEEYAHMIDGIENCDYYFLNFSKNGGCGMETSMMYLQGKTEKIKLIKEN